MKSFKKISEKIDKAKHDAIREDQETSLDTLTVTADQLAYARGRIGAIRKKRRLDIRRAKMAFKKAKVELDQAKNEGEIKDAKAELRKAILQFDKADQRDIRQLKQDLRRAKAERKAEVIRSKEALQQARIDLTNAKDKENLRKAKDDYKLAKQYYLQQVFKAESYKGLEESINEESVSEVRKKRFDMIYRLDDMDNNYESNQYNYE